MCRQGLPRGDTPHLRPATRHPPVHVPDLVVQGQERHRGIDGLSALGTEPHDFQPSLVDLLSQLIHGYVAWSTDKHGPSTQCEQMSVLAQRKSN